MPLPTLPSIPPFPTCPSWLDRNVGIVLYYKDKTAFITGATVRFKKIGMIDVPAMFTGVLYHRCIIAGAAISVFAQKNGIDFGNGKGYEAEVGYASIFDRGAGDYIYKPFVSNTEFSCPIVIPVPTIYATNFSSTNPLAEPNITVPPMFSFIIPGVGPASVTEGNFEIQLNETKITDGSIPSTGKIDVNLPTISEILKRIPSLVGKTSATVKVIIKWYHCKFENSVTVSLPSVPTLPCTGNFTKPDIDSLLAGITILPSTLFVAVGLTGDKTSVPVDIFVGGTRVATQPTGFTGFDLIKIIKDYSSLIRTIPNFSTYYNITIKSTLPKTECNIPDLVIPIKPIVPAKICTPPEVPNIITGKCEIPSIPGCAKFITTADTPSHPSGITDLSGTFYLFINKIKEECLSDPSIVSTKIPKGEDVIVTLGSLGTMHIPLTSDGQFNEDISKYFNFKLLTGITGADMAVTPTPEAVKPAAVGGERIGDYCEIRPMITTFAMAFFDVYHDTLGKIYSGNTYDQAKYKAQQDSRCFPKAALPCVKIKIYYRGTGKNAVIGFTSTVRDGRYAEGEQAWGWGGYPKIERDDYFKTVAIPKTMSYFGITRKEICEEPTS